MVIAGKEYIDVIFIEEVHIFIFIISASAAVTPDEVEVIGANEVVIFAFVRFDDAACPGKRLGSFFCAVVECPVVEYYEQTAVIVEPIVFAVRVFTRF